MIIMVSVVGVQREQADAADQGMSEQFDEQSLYDRACIASDSRL